MSDLMVHIVTDYNAEGLTAEGWRRYLTSVGWEFRQATDHGDLWRKKGAALCTAMLPDLERQSQAFYLNSVSLMIGMVLESPRIARDVHDLLGKVRNLSSMGVHWIGLKVKFKTPPTQVATQTPLIGVDEVGIITNTLQPHCSPYIVEARFGSRILRMADEELVFVNA